MLKSIMREKEEEADQDINKEEEKREVSGEEI